MNKCDHYSNVEEGWYCWKCLEREKTRERIKVIVMEVMPLHREIINFIQIIISITDTQKPRVSIPLILKQLGKFQDKTHKRLKGLVEEEE